MKYKISIIVSAFALLVISASTPVNADMASSAILAGTCYSCHGTGGISAGAMPSINGKPAKLLELDLKAFRDGTKESTVMQRIAKGFSDDEIKAISKYLAENAK